MTNIEKYNQAFIETFTIKEEELPTLKYQSIQLWDSIGHMSLVAALEESFDIMMETEDIIDLSSYLKGQSILTSNYEVEF